jgi:hypothetical protein
MPTKFTDGSSIKREIRVSGNDQPVLVEINAQGVSFWVKGSRKRVRTGWLQAVEAGYTGDDVPSFLAGHPLDMLKSQAGRANKTT